MRENTCCFIGHRTITETDALRAKLTETIEGLITREQVEDVIKVCKNQYGAYLQDVLDGKYLDVIRDKKRLEKLEEQEG